MDSADVLNELAIQLDSLTEHMWETAELADDLQVARINELMASDVANPPTLGCQVPNCSEKEDPITLSAGFHTFLCNQKEFQPAKDHREVYEGTLEAISRELLVKPKDNPGVDDGIRNIIQSCTHLELSPSVCSPTSDASSDIDITDAVQGNVAKALFPPDEPIPIIRGKDPINEFHRNKVIFAGSFVNLFMFGMDRMEELPEGSLPHKFVLHLIRQMTGKFGQSRKFLFTVMNQKQRHAACRAVTLQARTKPADMLRVGELASSLSFKNKVDRAINDPSGVEAKEVMEIIRPLISITGGKIPYSPSDRASGLMTMYSFCHYVGLPSIFLTIAQDAPHNCLVIRFSHPSGNNFKFPAQGDSFLESLQNGDTLYEEKIPIDNNHLMELANNNPTAEAEVFQLLIDTIYEVLLGIPRKENYRKSSPLSKHSEGIFGKVLAAFGANEAQSRRLLHIHMVIWTTLNPTILQKVSAFKELSGIIGEVLDSIFSCSISLVHHLQAYTRLLTPPGDRMPFDPLHEIYICSPCAEQDPIGFRNRYSRVQGRTGVHQHAQTCRKGKIGKKSCRLSLPMAVTHQTGPVQIKLDPAEVLPYIQICPIERENTSSYIRSDTYYERPFLTRDTRCINWSVRRPMEDKLVVCNADLIQYLHAVDFEISRESCPEDLNIMSMTDEEFRLEFINSKYINY